MWRSARRRPTQRFDRVVIATHADEALALLADPTAAESEVLGAFRYSRNETVLHRDGSLMPRAPPRPRLVELPRRRAFEGCRSSPTG